MLCEGVGREARIPVLLRDAQLSQEGNRVIYVQTSFASSVISTLSTLPSCRDSVSRTRHHTPENQS